jgi:hypothetical protein
VLACVVLCCAWLCKMFITVHVVLCCAVLLTQLSLSPSLLMHACMCVSLSLSVHTLGVCIRRKASGEPIPQTEAEMSNLQKNDTRLRKISMKMYANDSCLSIMSASYVLTHHSSIHPYIIHSYNIYSSIHHSFIHSYIY